MLFRVPVAGSCSVLVVATRVPGINFVLYFELPQLKNIGYEKAFAPGLTAWKHYANSVRLAVVEVVPTLALSEAFIATILSFGLRELTGKEQWRLPRKGG